jgi:hypothetical protein
MDTEGPLEVLPTEEQIREQEQKSNTRRIIVRRIIFGMALVILVPPAIHFARLWLPKLWGSLHIVNFVVAAIPTILSILFAFIIDKDLEHHMRKRWRLSIVAVGLLYSMFLWHQQDLTDKANAGQTESAINTAITKANAHSDQKFGEIQGTVNQLGSQVDGMGKALGNEINTATEGLNKSIGSVGKPIPADRPKLVFSLWQDGSMGKGFLESENLSPTTEGSYENYHVTFLVKNDSSVSAQGVEEWVNICDQCSFTSEPKGFDRPKGMEEHERHRSIPGINPGISLVEGNEFDVTVPRRFDRFQVLFKATCNTCGSLAVSKPLWIIRDYSMPQ